MNELRHLKLHGLIVALLLLSGSPKAEATWSIVAVDETTGEVGLAAATCGVGVHFIAAASRGAGVVAAQGATSFKGRDMAIEWMSNGGTAKDILLQLSDATFYDGWFDRDVADIQYGIATLTGGPDAGFVDGARLVPWSGGIAEQAYSVQGNTLRSSDVVAAAAMAMRTEHEDSCDLSLGERLLRALEAGRDAGGDNRCPLTMPAYSAVLLISRSESAGGVEDSAVLRLVAPKEIGFAGAIYHGIFPYEPDTDTPEPVAQLREMYEATGALRCRANLP